MKWYWMIPICIGLIGYFGIFWSLNLSEIEFEIKMDNNTLQAVESINYTALQNINKNNTCICQCIKTRGEGK